MKKAVLLLLTLLLIGCTANPVTDTQSHPNIDPTTLSEATFAVDSGDHRVRMLFVNVGKADCTILEADGKTYLIDTGEDSSVPQILAALAYMETEAIEAVFLTHSDKDHIGGWDGIRKGYPIGKLYTAALNEAPDTYTALAGEIPYETLMPGQSVSIGDEGLYLDVLCPITLYPEEENNNSLILRLDCGEETVLFTGDMKEVEEADLLATGYDLDCNILKVPYHGRKGAASQAFVDACTPNLSIICCNTKTDPDTANNKVVARLRQNGEVRLTEDADLGWYIDLQNEFRYITDAKIEVPPTASLTITEVSIKNQTITIENTGDTTDLTGYFLYSDRGSELFVFPENTVLPAGGSITVGCVGSNEMLIWSGETSIWHKSKKDNAILYDRYGNELDTNRAK